ncbi:MAG: L-2-hydroxyglutarate oxidase [Desulfuromonas sp.]|nr:L-2-hydroxyglutarate oxidase [Desulfuromonas sp.]
MKCDVVVIGGGIVGAATALALTEQSPDCSILVLEKETTLARHQTGNNSGVIHSGLYYRPGSLKARNCVEGREALYCFCAEQNIPHERCGKVVVATNEREVAALDELERRGHANGLQGLERLDEAGLKHYEPNVAGIAGLLVPETGIVDYVKVTEAYARLVVERGGRIMTGAEVQRIEAVDDGFNLTTAVGTVQTRFVINCAGLHCDRVARMCGAEPGVRIIPFRGEYYKLVRERRSLVKNLIYPVPDPDFPFLGVHYTRMIHGDVEAGPNAVLAFKREGYQRSSFSLRDTLETVSYPGFIKLARRFWKVGLQEYHRSFSKKRFVHDLQHLLPGISGDDVYRAGAGVRAQAVAEDGTLLDDFQIFEQEGMVHVLNAPSPAATASLSIGQAVAARAVARFAL